MEQIPTLVEGHPELLEPLTLRLGGLAVRLLLPEPVLLVGDLVDASEHLIVVHVDLLSVRSSLTHVLPSASGQGERGRPTIEHVFEHPRFVHLDARSAFSLKEGAFVPEHLAALAAAHEMPAVALTDRDGLYGAARFVAACEKEGVRPILGASLTVRERGADAPVVLQAQDDRG
jgi:hypothetical protein